MSASSPRKRQSKADQSPGDAKRPRHASDAQPDRWDERQHCDVLHLGTASIAALPPLALPAAMSNAALDSDASLLAASLSPLAVDAFKAKYWRRKAVAIIGGGSARVEQLIAEELCGLDVKELMAASASEQIFVWMKEPPAAEHASPSHAPSSSAASPSSSASSSPPATAASQPITSFPLDNPNQLDAALACYNSGSSLYFRSPPALAHRFVRAFNAGVGFNFAGLDYAPASFASQPRGEIEVFASRAGHHTGFHFDFMDNFTIQLRGKKTWTLGAVDVQYPVRGFTPHYKDRSTDELQYKAHNACQAKAYAGRVPQGGDQVTLSAGDVLYHPAGIWHAVSCDEDSVSINISLIATTAADLISDAVRQLLWRTEAGRAGLCGTHEEMQQQLGQALTALEQSIHTKQLTERRILPPAMRAPRRREPVTIDASVDSMLSRAGRQCRLSEVDRFHINPLMVVTPHRGAEEGEEQEEDEAEVEGDSDEAEMEHEKAVRAETHGDEEDDECEEDKKEGVLEQEEASADMVAVIENSNGGASDHQRAAKSEPKRADQDGRDELSGSKADDGEHALYAVHHLFGNDSLDSAMRAVVRVPHSTVAVFEAIIAQDTQAGGRVNVRDLMHRLEHGKQQPNGYHGGGYSHDYCPWNWPEREEERMQRKKKTREKAKDKRRRLAEARQEELRSSVARCLHVLHELGFLHWQQQDVSPARSTGRRMTASKSLPRHYAARFELETYVS